jgi:hypothetical protein
VGFRSAIDYVVKPDIIIDTHRSQIVRRRESNIFAVLDDKTLVTPLNVITRKTVAYVLESRRRSLARGNIKSYVVANMSVSVGKPQVKQNGRFMSRVMEAVLRTLSAEHNVEG